MFFSCLVFVMPLWYMAVSLSLSIGILGQVWYLIVSIPDLCTLTYINEINASDAI